MYYTSIWTKKLFPYLILGSSQYNQSETSSNAISLCELVRSCLLPATTIGISFCWTIAQRITHWIKPPPNMLKAPFQIPGNPTAVLVSLRRIAWHTESWAPMWKHRPKWKHVHWLSRGVALPEIAYRRTCPKCPPISIAEMQHIYKYIVIQFSDGKPISNIYVRKIYLQCHVSQIVFTVVQILNGCSILVGVAFQHETFDKTALANSSSAQNYQSKSIGLGHDNLFM